MGQGAKRDFVFEAPSGAEAEEFQVARLLDVAFQRISQPDPRGAVELVAVVVAEEREPGSGGLRGRGRSVSRPGRPAEFEFIGAGVLRAVSPDLDVVSIRRGRRPAQELSATASRIVIRNKPVSIRAIEGEHRVAVRAQANFDVVFDVSLGTEAEEVHVAGLFEVAVQRFTRLNASRVAEVVPVVIAEEGDRCRRCGRCRRKRGRRRRRFHPLPGAEFWAAEHQGTGREMQLVLVHLHFGDDQRTVEGEDQVVREVLQVVFNVPLLVVGGVFVPECVDVEGEKVSFIHPQAASHPVAAPIGAVAVQAVEQRILQRAEDVGGLHVVLHRPLIVEECVEGLLQPPLLSQDDHAVPHQGQCDAVASLAPYGDVAVEVVPEALVLQGVLDVLQEEQAAQYGQRVAAAGVRKDKGVEVVKVDLPVLQGVAAGRIGQRIGQHPLQVVLALVTDTLQVGEGEIFGIPGQQLQWGIDAAPTLAVATGRGERKAYERRNGQERPCRQMADHGLSLPHLPMSE